MTLQTRHQIEILDKFAGYIPTEETWSHRNQILDQLDSGYHIHIKTFYELEEIDPSFAIWITSYVPGVLTSIQGYHVL